MADTTIGRRFTQLIQHLGISKNAFAQSLGKTATVIQHLVDERNKPGYDLLCKVFEVYPSVSKDWLLLGQGPMLLGQALPAESRSTPARKAGVGVGAQASLPLAPPPLAAEAAAEVAAAAPPAAASPPTTLVVPAATVAAETAAMLAAPSGAAEAAAPTPRLAANAAPTAPAEVYLTAALHAQHLQHQLALAEQRNQHLLEQQRLMQQLLDFTQRR